MKKDTLIVMDLFNKAIVEDKCREIKHVLIKGLVEYINKKYDVLNTCSNGGSLEEIIKDVEYCFGKREAEEKYRSWWETDNRRQMVSMLGYSMPTDKEIRVARYCFKTGELEDFNCFIDDLKCMRIINIDNEDCITAKLRGMLVSDVENNAEERMTYIKFDIEAKIKYMEDTEEFYIEDKKMIQSIYLLGAHQRVYRH